VLWLFFDSTSCVGVAPYSSSTPDVFTHPVVVDMSFPPQVIVGNAAWRFGSYLSYCRNGAELDEMPLYMFDKVSAGC
jgi:hypothetical protein